MISYFLSYIDNDIALKTFYDYTGIFTQNILGISLVKENIGNNNSEDIDSGPVLFGYGSVATIMNCKTMATLNVIGAKSTWSLLNCLGLPINLFGKKYYLLGKEPMYDIFMLWIAVDLIDNKVKI